MASASARTTAAARSGECAARDAARSGIVATGFLYRPKAARSRAESRCIEVRMSAHHLIYGELSEIDRFNWLSKAEAARNTPALFADDYPGGYEEFRRELCAYLEHPRRFIYTPLIMCKGKKPTAAG
jgi:hypothetical protein